MLHPSASAAPLILPLKHVVDFFFYPVCPTMLAQGGQVAVVEQEVSDYELQQDFELCRNWQQYHQMSFASLIHAAHCPN